MWKHRLHKGFHRIVGGSVALAGLLSELRQIDLSQISFLRDNADFIIAVSGLVIIALEFLPILGDLLDSGDCEDARDNT
jgi:hypothetical protein